MKLANLSPNKLSWTTFVVSILAVVLIVGSAAHAQTPQLSLADILIGLRSKKATLPERNTILTEAVRQRGVTFAMTPEIEKELETTGASPSLIDAIRQKIAALKAAVAVVKPIATPAATPAPTPAPPDFSFYQTRADQNATKGEFSLALTDYNKTLEMKPDNAVAYLGRGKTHYSLKSYDLSVKDFDKALELNPRDSAAFQNRGVAYEKLGETRKAFGDYQKAVDLDPSNDTAKASLKRVQDLIAAAEAAEAAKNVPPPAPEFLNLGVISAANSTKMVTPAYSVIAQRSQVEGKVVVDLDLDENGDVVSAKASSGHQMLRPAAEDAAKKSKFKPAMFNNRPIKAKAQIIYNFSLKAQTR